jgi:hypothetical protein
MFGFKRYITEEKNLHLEHLEDAVINDGSKGVIEAIAFSESMLDMLGGNAGGRYGITVKWDGAPAVFAGINPENGKFFVGSKSVFNKNPKINYTSKDIDNNHAGGLADKLKVALEHLPKLGIKGVLQGDMMFTDDIKSEVIDGESYITFTPNTITYAVPTQSDLAKKIVRAKMGVVWHTAYTGTDMTNMKASFGPDVSGLKKTPDVWFDNADLRDESGAATFTKAETTVVKQKINNLKRLASKKVLSGVDSLLSNKEISDEFKIYYNSLVRGGQIGNPTVVTRGFVEYIRAKYDADIAKLKTDAAKNRKQQKVDALLSYLKKNASILKSTVEIHQLLRDIKMLFVRKIEQVKSIGLFLRTDDGFEVTAPEGFVAIDHVSKRAYKLVDRMTFSKANFNAAKNWVKG